MASRAPHHAGNDVVTQVLGRGLCIGCGVCVAACPRNNLQMHHDGKSWFVSGSCEVGCGSCLDVCPFWFKNRNEDELAADLGGAESSIEGLGRCESLLAAWVTSEEDRLASSSGGVATWVLKRLLDSGAVDAVVLVAADSDGKRSYAIARDAAAVESGAGSTYEYHHLADVLIEARREGLRLAVAALPCAAKGLRLLAEQSPPFRQTIGTVVGLTCGHNKSVQFWRYLGGLHGLRPESVRVLDYRKKRADRPANDFSVVLEGLDASGSPTTVELSWLADVAFYWSHRFFSLGPCLWCDDLTAETADIVFMDGWLPAFEREWKGTTFVVDRSGVLASLDDTSGGARAGLEIGPDITDADVVASQASALAFKREALAMRLLAQPDELVRDGKRVRPAKGGKLSDRLRWSLDDRIARQTGGLCVEGEDRDRDAMIRALTAEARRTDRMCGLLRRVGL